MNVETIKALNSAIEKLELKKVAAEDALRAAENRARGWNPRRCVQLRAEIASLDERIERALNIIESEASK